MICVLAIIVPGFTFLSLLNSAAKEQGSDFSAFSRTHDALSRKLEGERYYKYIGLTVLPTSLAVNQCPRLKGLLRSLLHVKCYCISIKQLV